jgi:hypothetical protein
VTEEPATGPRPRSRRGIPVRLGLFVAIVLTLAGGSGAMAVGHRLGSTHEAVLNRYQKSGAAAPDLDEGVVPHAAAPTRSPQPGDPAAVRHAWARTQLQTILDAQAAALLRGDQAAFLAAVDPSASSLVDDLTRRFTALRAMNVTGWTEALADDPTAIEDGWRATVKIGYCFGVVGCTPAVIPVPTKWVETASQPMLVEFGVSGATDSGPRPWEVTELRVAVGARTVVAAPPRYANRVPALLAAAEEAAAVTDRYARWSAPPGRYLVFLAGPDEWGNWYGVKQAEWVAGYAMPINDRDTEIVLNGQRVTGDEVVDTLRHEFTHVVTLAGVQRDYSAQWWLVEGIAEYVRMEGRPLKQYELLSAAKRYVKQGGATDLGHVGEPPPAASTEEASGRYGVAFLTVRRLAERFGEDRMLAFFDAVVRKGTPIDQAATTTFGTEWKKLTDDCASYAKRNLS